jgi:hypothetical protein
LTARKLALSSGLSDSFSSMANVVPDATLCLSKLGSFTELSDEETCVLVSSVGVLAVAASGGLESLAGLAMIWICGVGGLVMGRADTALAAIWCAMKLVGCKL